MKRVIRASWDDMFTFTPGDIEPQVDDIIEELISRVREKYGRRFKKLQLDIDDIRWGKHSLKAQVTLYNGDRLISDSEFSFAAYDEYFDEDDYNQHITRTIVEFVDNLV